MMNYRIVMTNNSLSHHGILGQKWGVKNGPPYPLNESDKSAKEISIEKSKSKFNLSENQKKILKGIVIGAAAVGVGAATYQVFKNTSITAIAKEIPHIKDSAKLEKKAEKIMKNTLKDTDIVLNKGTEIHRVIGTNNFDLSKEDKGIYASYTKLDQIAYRYGLKDWTGTGKRYEVQLETLKDLRGPSKETAETIFNKLYESNDEYRIGLIDSITQQYYNSFKWNNGFKYLTDEQIRDKAERCAEDAFKRHPFETAMSNIVAKSNNSKKLVDEFRKQGYDFIEDYMDKGTFSNKPIILLNNESVVQTGMKEINLTYGNMKLAKNLLIKANHPGQYGWAL